MKEWTIMVYMAGDNNLSDDMISSINEIKDVSTAARRGVGGMSYSADITFVIEYDSAYPIADTVRYSITRESISETKFKESSNTAEAIGKMIEWSVTNHKAKNYALIISGHSDAFQGQTLLVDEHPPGVTNIMELQKEIAEAIKQIPRNKLNILGFEGCVMNTLEVMYEFRDTADVWISSQGSIPNYAWDYRSIAKAFVTNTKPINNAEFIKIAIDSVKNYHKRYSFGGRSVDLSACDLTKLSKFVSELNKLMFLLNISLTVPLIDFIVNPENFDFLNHSIIRILLTSHWKSQTFMHDQAVDLRDFAEILGKVCKDFVSENEAMVEGSTQSKCRFRLTNDFLNVFSKQCDKLSIFLDKEKIVIKGMTTGLEFHYARGISLFFPWTILAFLITRENYGDSTASSSKQLEFAKTPTGRLWISFLKFFLVLTERPKGQLDDTAKQSLTKILSKVFTTAATTLSETPNDSKSDENNSLNVEEMSCMILKYLEDNNQSLEEFLNLEEKSLSNVLPTLEEIHATFFASESGGTRDDHIRTRDGIDNRVYYFGRYRNLRVRNLELDSDF